MVRTAVVGLGKMGLSHLSMIKAHPHVELVGVCDMSKYLLDVLAKNAGIAAFTDVEEMLKATSPEAVIVATPSRRSLGIFRLFSRVLLGAPCSIGLFQSALRSR
jgi:scyllo-inositol 2-dehydrogenase (NADP+)